MDWTTDTMQLWENVYLALTGTANMLVALVSMME